MSIRCVVSNYPMYVYMYCVLVIDTRNSSSLIIEHWLLAMVLRGRRGENEDLDLDIGGWVRGER